MTDQNLMRTIVGRVTPEFLQAQGIVPLSVNNGTLLVGTWRDDVASDTVFQLESLFSARINFTPIDGTHGRDAIRLLYEEPAAPLSTLVVEAPPPMREPTASVIPEDAGPPNSPSPIVTEPLRIDNVQAPASDSFPAIDAVWPAADAAPATNGVTPTPDAPRPAVDAAPATRDVTPTTEALWAAVDAAPATSVATPTTDALWPAVDAAPATSKVIPTASETSVPDHRPAPADNVPTGASQAEDDSDDGQVPAPGTLRALANDPSVVRLVGLILNGAIKQRVSEIRFENRADSLRVRYLVGEELRDALSPPRSMAPAVMSRLKNMAHLDLTGRRTRQEGSFRLAMARGELDMHVTVSPSPQGEMLVLRLKNVEPAKRELEMLGMSPADQARFEKVVTQRRGMILVTGPTGSGKTTTLYAALRRLQRDGAKILTVEEPVAYQLDGVTQVPVNERAGVTFASALRVMLRQEPDVLFVGEIRDADTAEVATQTALTGHFVLSSIEATDAVDALANRLASLGLASFLVAGSVEAVVAQRIIRTVCPICATGVAASESDRTALGSTNSFQVTHGVGCDACEGSGYLGKTALFEVLVLDDAIRAAVSNGAGSAEIVELARAAGLSNLHDDGVRLVREGVTTPEEVVKVTQGMSRRP